jgi:hypothetical protein
MIVYVEIEIRPAVDVKTTKRAINREEVLRSKHDKNNREGKKHQAGKQEGFQVAVSVGSRS